MRRLKIWLRSQVLKQIEYRLYVLNWFIKHQLSRDTVIDPRAAYAARDEYRLLNRRYESAETLSALLAIRLDARSVEIRFTKDLRHIDEAWAWNGVFDAMFFPQPAVAR